jgi:hypothetical protein
MMRLSADPITLSDGHSPNFVTVAGHTPMTAPTVLQPAPHGTLICQVPISASDFGAYLGRRE